MSSNFFAMVERMKLIDRWALMNNTGKENIAEHSHTVAVIAHALALIGNKKFGRSYNAERCALLALYHDTTEVINFISSVSVFAMSCSSTVKHLRAKTKVDFKTVLLISAGSILGGFAGKHIFDLFNRLLSDNLAMACQAVLLACLLAVALWYVNKGKKSFHLKNPITILLGGVVLGILSSFLGIGGGPINIMFFLLFFSMSMKEATVYSVAVIFFSQLSKLVTYVATATVPKFDYRILLIAAPAAVIAGIIGAALNKKANNKIVTRVFSAVLGVFICLNIYNAITGFMAG